MSPLAQGILFAVFVVLCLWALAWLIRRSRAWEAEADEVGERALRKAVSLRERHDLLLKALETLVIMHTSAHESVGNWDWAIGRAKEAIALAKTPLVPEGSVDLPQDGAEVNEEEGDVEP